MVPLVGSRYVEVMVEWICKVEVVGVWTRVVEVGCEWVGM